MPVLALGDAGPRDVHGELAVVGGFQELREAASLVLVHLQVKGHLFLGQVGQVHGVELLLQTARWDGGHHEGLGLVVEGVQAALQSSPGWPCGSQGRSSSVLSETGTGSDRHRLGPQILLPPGDIRPYGDAPPGHRTFPPPGHL